MNKYLACFDFTTVHANSKFIGRSGQCEFETDNDLEQVKKDTEEITNLCSAFIYSQKPNWKVFMITITDIKQIN